MHELPDFEPVRVLCLGDLMLDRFIEGAVNRISPESPVPIIQMKATQSVPGGAANVARNVAALGGFCTIVGVVGDDAVGNELTALIAESGQVMPALVRDATRPTIEKIRFVSQGTHLLRADREEACDIPTGIAEVVIEEISRLLRDHDVLILSDYAKGLLTPQVVSAVIDSARKAGVPVIVDPKTRDLARYAGATVITPNAKEAALATGIEPVSDETAAASAYKALTDAGVESVLLTRSEQGMTLVTREGEVSHTAASAREVFDVVGAGDTVVATMALCVGGGMTLPEAAGIANAAAGVVVGKRGTATLTRSELTDELSRLSRIGISPSQLKIVSASRAVSLREQWARDGLRVGFTNGCFDILHVGHVGILEFARSRCDRLIVGVNADASVSRLKGPTRPINREDDRAQIIGAFGFVDAVIVFGEDTPYDLIGQIRPDVLVKGSDYTVEQVVGFDIVQQYGGEVALFELVPGRSTSNIIAKSQQKAEVQG